MGRYRGPVEYEEVEECVVIKEGAKAVLVRVDGAELWVPRSLIKNGDKVRWAMAGVTLEVAGWFARDRGMI